MKKIGLLSLALVLALGSLGIGYAHWSETLQIKGTIATGDIDPKFSEAESNDGTGELDPQERGSWCVGATNTWTGERYTKDTGLTDTDIPSAQDHRQVTITCTNAYPSYWASVVFKIVNEGTVPAALVGLKLVEISGPGGVVQVDQVLKTCKTYYVDWEQRTVSRTRNLNGPNTDDYSLHISELAYPTQIDPWDWDAEWDTEIWGDIDFHVENGALEDTTYDFTVELYFVNWNESSLENDG
jgi:hypothetical protein